MQFSIIIPTLNEVTLISACVTALRALEPQAEILVADGGSTDGTPEAARQAGAQVIAAKRGRGSQCQAAAQQARGDLLLFLHVDTQLSPDAFDVALRCFQDPQVLAATFRVRFAPPHPFLALCAPFARFDSVFTRFGDQGILIRRDFYRRLGGFPDWPLFEDVRLLQLARRYTRVVSLPATVTTSSRRYLERGVVRQQLFNLWLMLQYLAGVSPQRLAQKYYKK